MAQQLIIIQEQVNTLLFVTGKGESMKKLILLFLFIFMAGVSSADYYIFNSENRCVSKTSYLPDEIDLSSREEFSIYDESDIPISEAEYRGGKVKVRVKSQEEKNKDQVEKEEKDQMKEVYHAMFVEAAKKTYRNGGKIDKLNNHVDVEAIKAEVDAEQ